MNPSGAADWVYPPTHDPIPGVYLAAMALDNLLTYGSDYIRDAPGSWREFLVLTAALLVPALAAPLYHERIRRRANPPTGRRAAGMWLLWLGSIFSIQLALGAFAFWELRLSPLNWLGFLLVGGFLLSKFYRTVLEGISNTMEKALAKVEV